MSQRRSSQPNECMFNPFIFLHFLLDQVNFVITNIYCYNCAVPHVSAWEVGRGGEFNIITLTRRTIQSKKRSFQFFIEMKNNIVMVSKGGGFHGNFLQLVLCLNFLVKLNFLWYHVSVHKHI